MEKIFFHQGGKFMKINNEICTYISDNINNVIEVNNKYKDKGFNIFLENEYIEIIYNKSVYKITIIKKDNKLFWHLTPYQKNYFETEISTTRNSFEMIIYAIQDNESLYK